MSATERHRDWLDILRETEAKYSIADAIRWLYRYGYFNRLISGIGNLTLKDLLAKIDEKSPVFREAVRTFQEFYGLTIDGDLGPQSMHAMDQPRCAVPDILPEGAEGAGLCQWPRSMERVTYSFKTSGLNLSAEEWTRAFHEACENWNKVCGINLVYSTDFSRANIYANVGKIDGRSGTLAWSYLPCNASANSRMEQLYDSAESWNYRFAVEVIGHEVGHAIGLPHVNGNSIMHPSATGKWPVPQTIDIQNTQARYGKPVAKPTPAPEPEPPEAPTSPTTPVPTPPTDIPTEANPYADLVITSGTTGRRFRVVPRTEFGGLK